MLAIGCASGAPARAEPMIVRDGKPQAEIVISDRPPRMTKLAASELQAFVERISGGRLLVTNAPSRDVPAQIYVGRSAHTDKLGIRDDDLSYGAYRVVSGPTWMALIGRDTDFTPPEPAFHGSFGSKEDREKFCAEWDARTGDRFDNPLFALRRAYSDEMGIWEQDEHGTLNAVYDFLRGLGARWYYPGEVGEVLPKTATIALPKLDQTVRPDFPVRRWMLYWRHYAMASRDEILWQLRLGLLGGHEGYPDGLMGLGPPGHGIQYVILRDKDHLAPEECYTLMGGKRLDSPCLSSEVLFQRNVKFGRAMFDIYGQPRLDVSPTDGYNLCQCDACKTKYTPQRGWTGQASDYVWGYVNRVAQELYKTHPDRMVACLAYDTYALPPEKIEALSPNVAVVLCRARADHAVDPASREKFRKLVEAWLAKLPSKQLFLWDYYLLTKPGGAYEGVPVYFPHILSDDLRWLKGKSNGEFIEIYRNWLPDNLPWDAIACNHLNIYLTARLYWNAEENIGALLEDYCDKFYGPARAEMKSFIEYSEANWPKATKDVKVIDRMSELLAAARATAGDTVYGKRVGLVTDLMKPLVARRDQLAKGREGVPKCRAYHRDAPPVTLDGKLDDAFWQNMASYDLREVETGRAPAAATAFKVGWAGDSLYFGIECRDKDAPNLNITATKNEDANIFNGDNIELLFETQTHSYYQIAIGPMGAVMDLDRKRGIESLWASNIQVATHIGDGLWTVEVRVPVAGDNQEQLDALKGISGRQPSQTYPWYFNVGRQRMRENGRELSAFSPTGKPSFHELMKFAELYVR